MEREGRQGEEEWIGRGEERRGGWNGVERGSI